MPSSEPEPVASVRQTLRDVMNNPTPELLAEARASMRRNKKLLPAAPEWSELIKVGRVAAALVEAPHTLAWTPTPDGAGAQCWLDAAAGDFLVVHSHQGWWRAGRSAPGAAEPTRWHPGRASDIAAAQILAASMPAAELNHQPQGNNGPTSRTGETQRDGRESNHPD